MYGNRGDTIQPNGYLNSKDPQARPRQVQMRSYSRPNDAKPKDSSPKDPPPKYSEYKQSKQDPQPSHPTEYVKQNEPSMTGYIVHWVAFLIAMAVNIGIWAIDYFAVGRQASYYYYNTNTVSAYIDTTTYASSTKIFTTVDPFDTTGTAMALVYSWVLWKGPILVYALNLIERQQNKAMKYVTFIAEVLILLGVDIVLTIYALSFYSDWIYYAIFVVLTIIVALINNSGLDRNKETFSNTIPLFILAGLYVIYTLLLPTLYNFYSNNLSNVSTVFLVIYLYPAFDLLIYALTLYFGNKVEPNVKGLFSSIHYFLIGYGAGMILIVGYTEVEFYYLIGYFIFRNVFVNYIMRRWERVVANPPALPGWGIAYYLGYGLSYLPVVGVGKLVVSKSFLSYLFALTPTLLYGAYNPLYPSTSPPTASLPNTNSSIGGNIYWLAGAIIWLAMTFSQRYDKKMPQIYDFFYYLVGIHFFYVGIASSLAVYTLTTSAHL